MVQDIIYTGNIKDEKEFIQYLRFNFPRVTKNLLSQHKYYHQPNVIDDYVHLNCIFETSFQSSVH